METLSQGGKAFDAGVTALLVGGVVEQDLYGLGGEALILVYPEAEGKVTSIVGQGWAPHQASIEWYRSRNRDLNGEGRDPAVVPGALHGALTVLERWGTMSFEQVAARDSYYANPDVVDVPSKGLLSKIYGKTRAAEIDMTHASVAFKAGDPLPHDPDVDVWTYWVADIEDSRAAEDAPGSFGPSAGRLKDTTHIAVIDKDGNIFDSRPGGDNQEQTILQTFLNIVEFWSDWYPNPHDAFAVPRVRTQHLYGSFWPHAAGFNQLDIESTISAEVAQELRRRGHHVNEVRPLGVSGCATMVMIDPATGNRLAAADPRRDCYAMAY